MLINAVKTDTEEVLEIVLHSKRQEQIDSFMYLASSVKDTDCVGKVKSRMAVGMTVMVK